MKWIRKIGTTILSILIIDGLFAIVLSFNFKNIIIDNIVKTTVFSEKSFNQFYTDNTVIDEKYINEIKENKKAQELMNSPEFNELLEKYLDITIDSLEDEEISNQIELESDIISFLKNNKDKLNEIVGEQVTNEMIDDLSSKLDTKELTKKYKDSIKNSKTTLSESEINIFKAYDLINSPIIKISSIAITLICAGLLLLIQRPKYMFIKNISNALWVTGLGIIIINITLKTIMKSLIGITINSNSKLITLGIIFIIYSSLLFIVYKIIENKMKGENKDEISK